MKAEVIDSYARSISVIWIVMTPVVGVGFLLSRLNRRRAEVVDSDLRTALGLRKYTLTRNFVKQSTKEGKGEDIEKGSGGGNNDEEKDSGGTIGSKTVDEAVGRPGTGTTLAGH